MKTNRKTSEIQVLGGGESVVPVARLRRRRSILNRVLTAAGAVAGSSVLAACGAPGRPDEEDEPMFVGLAIVEGKIVLSLASYPRLKEVGSSLITVVEGLGPVIVAHEEQGKFVAASGDCTHMKCPLRYNGLNHTYDCSCHGSTFEVDGVVINGPAVKPLATFDVEFDGQTVIVTMK